MELKIYNPTQDGFIQAIEWNHEEIKQEVAAKVEYYKNLVYTDDQIKDAKADRATLNKFAKALDDKRKEIKKKCLAPYEDFEAKMKEILAIVNEPITVIDHQVKEYEEKQKQDKREKIKEYWAELLQTDNIPEGMTLEKIFNAKWLNTNASMKSIKDEINARLEQIAKDFEALENLPEYGFEAKQTYIATLDVVKSLNEANRLSEMAKQKAEHEARMKAMTEKQAVADAEAMVKKEQVVTNINDPVDIENLEPQKQWISFSALLSTEDAIALKEFFNNRHIEFRAI